MIIYFATVFGLYFLLLIFLRIGWIKAIKKKIDTVVAEKKFISVVIAVRNEASSINQLLSRFLKQSYSQNNFEIIIVDDHSEDDSNEELVKWKDRLPIVIISLNKNESGKKAALAKGIALTKGDIIVTTDADCLVPVRWLERIDEKFQEKKINMLIGLVSIEKSENIFQQLQALEFASVIGTGVASQGLRRPTMCNGANLSFRKKTFYEVDGYFGNEHIASGDDEFFMHKIHARFPDSIQVLNSEDSVVITKPLDSLKDFIQQRLRWASKWKVNSSMFSKSLAVFMFIVQVSSLMLMIVSFTYPQLIFMLIIKILFDVIFIFPICNFLKIKFQLLLFIALQFIYPFYVLYIGIFSQLKSHEWKGRKF